MTSETGLRLTMGVRETKWGLWDAAGDHRRRGVSGWGAGDTYRTH